MEFEPPSGLEYESRPSSHQAPPPDSPSAGSLGSVDISTASPQHYLQDQQGGMHRRRPHGGGHNNGYGAGGGYSANGGGRVADTDKYSRAGRGPKVMRNLDFFPKVERDLSVRTERGGQVMVAGYVLMLVLVFAEFATWVGQNFETTEHVVVDTSLGKKMRVYLNITFPALHCDDLHLDVIDVVGDSQVDISDTLYKKRLNPNGSLKFKNAEGIAVEANVKAEEDRKKQEILKEGVPKDYCGPCYGAQESDEDCCQTCDEVMERYRKKRWNENAVLPLSEQCIREGRGNFEAKKMTQGEGCNLQGYMTLNRCSGNFHIAMGEGVDRNGRHVHQFLPEDRPNFNASHVIHGLRFADEEYGDAEAAGENGGKGGSGVYGEMSLNGVSKIVTEETGTTGLFQYFIKVVPTTYKGDALDGLGIENSSDAKGQRKLETNRYFYTERYRPLLGEVNEEAILSGDPDRGMASAAVGGKVGGSLHDKNDHHHTANAVLPGVFFVYEMYPFAVEVTRNSVPLAHLLIRIMATMGGVFTIMSWLDGALYSREKKRKGRL